MCGWKKIISTLDLPFPNPPAAENFIRLEKGSHLQDAEFEQVKEFVLQLPDRIG